jgi:predicted nucleotidyltransferase
MIVWPCTDPILKRFRAALDPMYGERIERVVLFGSRARGDARQDSDYDVAVFLQDLTERWPELNRLADLGTDILEKPESSSTPCPTAPVPTTSIHR